MKTTRTNKSEIFKMMWQFIKRNGYTRAEALKCAWRNFKLRIALHAYKVVKFYFQKVDGTIREAFGTLKAEALPQGQGTGRRPSELVQVYFDTERGEYRCFKKANLIRIA